MDEQSKII